MCKTRKAFVFAHPDPSVVSKMWHHRWIDIIVPTTATRVVLTTPPIAKKITVRANLILLRVVRGVME